MATVSNNAEQVTRVGLAATYHGSLSTSDTYNVPNDGRTVLHFKKTGAGVCTVSFTVAQTVDGLTPGPKTVSIPATTGDKFVGPFPREVYGETIAFTCSEITGLSFAALTR